MRRALALNSYHHNRASDARFKEVFGIGGGKCTTLQECGARLQKRCLPTARAESKKTFGFPTTKKPNSETKKPMGEVKSIRSNFIIVKMKAEQREEGKGTYTLTAQALLNPMSLSHCNFPINIQQKLEKAASLKAQIEGKKKKPWI